MGPSEYEAGGKLEKVIGILNSPIELAMHGGEVNSFFQVYTQIQTQTYSF